MPALELQTTPANVTGSPFVVAAPATANCTTTRTPAINDAPTPATMARRARLPSMEIPPQDRPPPSRRARHADPPLELVTLRHKPADAAVAGTLSRPPRSQLLEVIRTQL